MPRLKLMRFKDFTWPNNPETYNISYQKKIIKHSYIGINKEEIENMGMDARVMSGTGVFFGPKAYYNFSRLATIFSDKTHGVLFHPIWMNTTVFFTKLTVKNEPLPDYVAYDFEFIEHVELDIIKEITSISTSDSAVTNSITTSSNSIIHTVKQGETLSGIAAKYGVSWKTVADDNKSVVKNPNSIQIGWKLTINNPTKNTVSNSTKPKTNSTTKPTSKGTGDKAYDRFMAIYGDTLGQD